MGWFTDIMGAVGSWITARGNVAELRYKKKISDRKHKEWVNNQWSRLLSSEDYNSVKLLNRFINKDNEWLKIDEELDSELRNVQFCGVYRYDDLTMYKNNVEYPMFQTETRIEKHKKYPNEEQDYIRINPILYPDLCKNMEKHNRKGLI